MKVIPTAIAGVFIVELEPITDHRGSFARLWSGDDFSSAGIEVKWAQCNLGHSLAAGTLRGLHYQRGGSAESKLIWCGSGSLYDVAVDLRPNSPTRFQWVAAELTAENRKALYLPPGTAHGYQTLEAKTDLWYLTSQAYDAAAATGARWNDPAFAIDWPLPPGPMSEQDANWPLQGAVS
jgi:dTDP-4-dehydrorhamnose 3,5-epimerase